MATIDDLYRVKHKAERVGGEMRHADERGLESERAIAEKRADYFAAGTLTVWDVDFLSEDVVRVYRASGPNALPFTAAATLPRPSRRCRDGPCR